MQSTNTTFLPFSLILFYMQEYDKLQETVLEEEEEREY